MTKKIRSQRAYVAQCEAALQHYVAEGKAGRSANYGNLSGLIRTAQDVVHVQTGKLMQMEREAEEASSELDPASLAIAMGSIGVEPKDGPSYADIQERWALDVTYGARDD